MNCNWPELTIDELKSSEKGSIAMGPFGSRIKAENFVKSGVPVLKGGNLHGAYIDDNECDYLTEEKADELKSSNAFEGDIVITHRGTIGQVSIIPKGATYNRYVVSQSQLKVSLDKEKVNPYYVNYFLRSRIGQHRLLSYASQVGVPAIAKASTSVKQIQVPCPPLAVQDEIVSFLQSLDHKLTVNNQINQSLEEMAQAIFKSWFVDFDPVKAKMNGAQPEGMDAATASLFPEKLVESEEGMIPEGWSVEPLKNVSRVINGRAYKNTEFREEGTPIIRIQNLTGKGKTVYSDMVLPEDKLVEHGDLIFAWSATFGPHLWRGPKSIYHYHIWKMDVNETKFGKYLLYLHLARLTNYLKNQGTGSIFTHLTKGIMESQKLVVPSEEIVEAFSKVATPLFAQIDSLHRENKILEQLRDTLLPKLLSGEIELGR
ncbi:Type I restriction-modification system, specificity subunit S [Vibrio chagasii]|nr:Type I restriction-modification system, specificity subunit S [Vibrio chagasii]CAH6908110.1 Type I restriction-modification system, specificity subunit S [Vibrio chagasii]